MLAKKSAKTRARIAINFITAAHDNVMTLGPNIDLVSECSSTNPATLAHGYR